MNQSRSVEKRSQGFTLIEVLVVIGIIAVLAGAALPNLVGAMRASRIRSGQDDVAGALQRARNLAIMKNSQMGVSFVIENDTTYWVHIEDAITGGVAMGRQGIDFAAPVEGLSTRYTLPPDVEFAANAADCPGITGFAPTKAALRFDRYGVTSIPPASGADRLILDGGSTATNRLFVPTTDRAVCLIDRVTELRRWVQISPGGRIVRR